MNYIHIDVHKQIQLIILFFQKTLTNTHVNRNFIYGLEDNDVQGKMM